MSGELIWAPKITWKVFVCDSEWKFCFGIILSVMQKEVFGINLEMSGWSVPIGVQGSWVHAFAQNMWLVYDALRHLGWHCEDTSGSVKACREVLKRLGSYFALVIWRERPSSKFSKQRVDKAVLKDYIFMQSFAIHFFLFFTLFLPSVCFLCFSFTRNYPVFASVFPCLTGLVEERERDDAISARTSACNK